MSSKSRGRLPKADALYSAGHGTQSGARLSRSFCIGRLLSIISPPPVTAITVAVIALPASEGDKATGLGESSRFADDAAVSGLHDSMLDAVSVKGRGRVALTANGRIRRPSSASVRVSASMPAGTRL